MTNVRFFGEPGHFCMASRCCWHLHAVVGGTRRVSGVGCCHREWSLKDRSNENRITLGWPDNSYYEVLVFDVETDAEISGRYFETAEQAEAGFLEYLERYGAVL